MPLQFPAPINQLSLPAVDQAVQQTEWNALRNEAAGHMNESRQTANEQIDRQDTGKFLMGLGTMMEQGLSSDPQWFAKNHQNIVGEFQRRRLPAENVPQPGTSLEQLMQDAGKLKTIGEMSMMGVNPERQDLTADQSNYEYLSRLSDEERELWFRMKRGQPGLQLKEIVRSDGSKQMVVWDEEQGVGYDLQGNPISTGAGGTPGEGVQAAVPPGSPQIGVSPTPQEQAANVERAKLLTKLEIEDDRAYNDGIITMQSSINDMQTAITNIDNAIGAANLWSTGIPGQIMQNLGATDARSLQAKLEPVKAALAFDRLQQMRDASKTGGALGQVSERELNLLMNAKFALDQAQDTESLISSLMSARTHYQNVLRVQKAQQMLNSGEAKFAATVKEAMGYPPGTLIVNPNGEIRRVPNAR